MESERLTKLAFRQVVDMVNYSDFQEIIGEEIEKRIDTNIFVYSSGENNTRIIYAINKKEAIKKLIKILPLLEKYHFILRPELINTIFINKCIVCGDRVDYHNNFIHYLRHDENTIIDSIFDNNIKVFLGIKT